MKVLCELQMFAKYKIQILIPPPLTPSKMLLSRLVLSIKITVRSHDQDLWIVPYTFEKPINKNKLSNKFIPPWKTRYPINHCSSPSWETFLGFFPSGKISVDIQGRYPLPPKKYLKKKQRIKTSMAKSPPQSRIPNVAHRLFPPFLENISKKRSLWVSMPETIEK